MSILLQAKHTLTTGKYRHTFLSTHMRGMHDRTSGKREYHGEVQAEPLVEWLNWVASKRSSEPHRMALGNVLGIRDAILQLQDKAQKMISGGAWRGKSKEFKNEELALNAKLQDYAFAYAVDPSKQEPMVWTMSGNEDPTSELYVRRETIAILHIIELAKRGLLNKVRKCDCGKYFFARLSGQRFHSAECRVRFWEASPERKKRRRDKAREYYYLHKSGKVR